MGSLFPDIFFLRYGGEGLKVVGDDHVLFILTFLFLGRS